MCNNELILILVPGQRVPRIFISSLGVQNKVFEYSSEIIYFAPLELKIVFCISFATVGCYSRLMLSHPLLGQFIGNTQKTNMAKTILSFQ